MSEQSVAPGHSHIIETNDLVTECLGCYGSLLCYRDVARAARSDDDPADAVRFGFVAYNSNACSLAVKNIMMRI